MWPLLAPGSLVRLRPLRTGEPVPGQIICFVLRRTLVIHRLVRLLPGGFVARGDAAACFDPPLPRHRLVGVFDRPLTVLPAWKRFLLATPRLSLFLALATWPLAGLIHRLDILLHRICRR